jgi:membrane fusion protein, type I secretion system
MSEQDPRAAIRKLNLVGLATIVVLVGGIGGWAATSQLAGAVIASGTIVVESTVKKVQHPTGGIVAEIFVTEGNAVEAGQLLLRLDETLTRATLGVVRSQLDQAIAREARLLAERDRGELLFFPNELLRRQEDATVMTALVSEWNLIEARRRAQVGQRAQLRERVDQINEEIRGLSAQQQAKEQEIKFIAEELAGVQELYEKQLVTIVRLMQLKRDHVRLDGERGHYIAEIARARGKIGEVELQIVQLEQDFRTEVLKDLRDVEGKIAELKERFIAAEDQLKRVEIRAPQAGVVHQLAVHTIGGVINNGETIMHIVPATDALVIEAKVAPPDIDQVALGAPVAVRIMAGNQRTTPELTGRVSRVSADLMREPQTNQTYYLIRATLDEEQVLRLGDLKLQPGMPAETFIQTYERTPLQFLLKPLQEQVARAFRER